MTAATKTVEPEVQAPEDPRLMRGTPIWFAREVLKMELYPWQEEVLWDLATNEDQTIILKAANGSGKTQGIATVALLWHCACFSNSQVVTTAGVYRQVKEQLWGNIRQQQAKLGPTWKINTTDLQAPNGSKAIGFSTDHAKKFEGFHNDNLLIILDEAKSIPDELWEAVQRCNAPRVRVLVMSSTGLDEGFFAEAFHTKREFFSHHSVTSYDCPHLSDKWIDKMIRMWGKDHPLVRSMIFSEFIEGGVSDYCVSPVKYGECIDNPPEHVPGNRLAFIDWAAGGDENVIAILNGNEVEHVIAWREKNTMAAANKAAIKLLEYGVPRNRIFADDGGLGHPINDAMAEAGFPIRRVLNNMKASQPDHFLNIGAELWIKAGQIIGRKEVILPDDTILREQATGRKIVFTASGKMALQKKDELPNSPDRADAVLSAISIAAQVGNEYDSALEEQLDGDLTDSQLEQLEEESAGSFAGL